MGRNARHVRLAAICCWCAALVACGQPREAASGAPPARTPLPAPHVVLTDDDRALWRPGPPRRSVVPVLVYDGVGARLGIGPREFARQMVLFHHAGYQTITLGQFVRFIDRDAVRLPPRPLLLTFDGGRLDSYVGTDAILRELGFNAAVFVDVGAVEAGDRDALSWKELNALQRSGRWEVQLRSGTGGAQRIRYGPGPDDVGPFYAYRGADEVLGGWRERVFSDISYGEHQLAFHVRGYRPMAFAPPYGDYGQAGTNDPRIPRELLVRLLQSFQVVFTQDRSALATPGAANPFGRIEMTRDVSEAELSARLHEHVRSSPVTGIG